MLTSSIPEMGSSSNAHPVLRNLTSTFRTIFTDRVQIGTILNAAGDGRKVDSLPVPLVHENSNSLCKVCYDYIIFGVCNGRKCPHSHIPADDLDDPFVVELVDAIDEGIFNMVKTKVEKLNSRDRNGGDGYGDGRGGGHYGGRGGGGYGGYGCVKKDLCLEKKNMVFWITDLYTSQIRAAIKSNYWRQSNAHRIKENHAHSGNRIKENHAHSGIQTNHAHGGIQTNHAHSGNRITSNHAHSGNHIKSNNAHSGNQIMQIVKTMVF
jgi:hypothetical protein